MFGPNEAIKGRYALLAKDWEKYKGTVTYQDQHYTVKADDALSILMVDLEKAVNNQIKNKEEKRQEDQLRGFVSTVLAFYKRVPCYKALRT